MSGVQLRVDISGLAGVRQALDNFARFDRRGLLDTVGAVVESQTRRRISDEKESPDGMLWPAWSGKYAKKRGAGHSLLESGGDLLDSIDHQVPPGAAHVEIGTNMIYAATHQFGDDERNIPARPYLGVSAGDESELQAVIHDWFAEILK
jgi:phage virion morphogenesis protein